MRTGGWVSHPRLSCLRGLQVWAAAALARPGPDALFHAAARSEELTGEAEVAVRNAVWEWGRASATRRLRGIAGTFVLVRGPELRSAAALPT